MVLGAPHTLTKVSFRRDVRFFLGTLVGFLVFLILILLLLLQNAVLETEMTMREEQEIVAEAAVAMVNRASRSPQDLRTTLTAMRMRYGLAAATLTGGAQTIRAGTPIDDAPALTRPTYAGTLTLTFDPSPIDSLRRRFFLTAGIVGVAVTIGTILLLLYAPKITRPVEQLLDEAATVEQHDPAVDEQQYLIGTFRKTIATLRSQEEELRRLHSQEKTRADDFERVAGALTRSLTSGFIAIDPSGRIVDINQSGRDILRLDANAPLVGEPLAASAAPLEFRDALAEAIAGRQSLTRREIDIRTADGGRLSVGVSTVPLLNEEGAFLGMVALFTDLTPIQELESRMREMQTLADLGEMSAGIAHEFRNSLATILGYLKLAQKQSDTDAMRDKLRKAEEEASALATAIVSLLNFTRPMTIEPQTVDLRSLVQGIVARLEPQATDVTFTIEGTAEIEGDPGLLVRAVENIIRNAIDAVHLSGTAGRIEITLHDDPPAIRIRDNGVGLRAEESSRTVFVPFQSQKPGGIGLGLPLAKKIALLHGGSISLAPAPGGGAVATIEFGQPAPLRERVTAAR